MEEKVKEVREGKGAGGGAEINDFKELTYTSSGLDTLKHDRGDRWTSDTGKICRSSAKSTF